MTPVLVPMGPRGEVRAPVLGADAPWRSADLLRAAVPAVVGFAGLSVTWFGASGEAAWPDALPWTSLGAAAITVALLGLTGWLLAGLRRVRRLRRDVLSRLQAAVVVADAAAAPGPASGPTQFVTAPGMTRFHRPACPLAVAKPVQAVAHDETGASGLVPCGVCAP